MDILGTWSGLIEVPYDDFVAGIEALKQVAIIKEFVKTKRYLNEDDIARVLGMEMREE